MYTLRPLLKISPITWTTKLGLQTFTYETLRLNKKCVSTDFKLVDQTLFNKNDIGKQLENLSQQILVNHDQQMTILKALSSQDRHPTTYPKFIETIVAKKEPIANGFKWGLMSFGAGVGIGCLGAACVGVAAGVWEFYNEKMES